MEPYGLKMVQPILSLTDRRTIRQNDEMPKRMNQGIQFMSTSGLAIEVWMVEALSIIAICGFQVSFFGGSLQIVPNVGQFPQCRM